MNIKARYIHGSEDSTDVDVHYVVDALPDKAECKRFCSEDKSENRNLIVIQDGIVVDCYKGTPDETNNALLATYRLHKQDYSLLVEREVPRDVYIKVIRAVRIILSHLSRSQYRAQIKTALREGWAIRMFTMYEILGKFNTIDFTALNNNMDAKDIKKVLAFQVGQTTALVHGKELYTKWKISQEFPYLKPFLYREELRSNEYALGLEFELYKFFDILSYDIRLGIDFDKTKDNLVKFYRSNNVYNLLTEKIEYTV